MKIVAHLRYLNITPRKVRLIAKLIRGKTVKDAQSILVFTVKRGTRPILKLLRSAVANAKDKYQFEEDNLYISKMNVDEGPKRRKWRARARGVAARIEKKTSHIALFLDQTEKRRRKKAKKGEEKHQKEIALEKKKSLIRKPKFQAEPIKTQRPQAPLGGRKIFRRKAF